MFNFYLGFSNDLVSHWKFLFEYDGPDDSLGYPADCTESEPCTTYKEANEDYFIYNHRTDEFDSKSAEWVVHVVRDNIVDPFTFEFKAVRSSDDVFDRSDHATIETFNASFMPVHLFPCRTSGLVTIVRIGCGTLWKMPSRTWRLWRRIGERGWRSVPKCGLELGTGS
jgi:hypothetical protein